MTKIPPRRPPQATSRTPTEPARLPDIAMPDIAMPDVAMPDVAMPETAGRDIAKPGAPASGIPAGDDPAGDDMSGDDMPGDDLARDAPAGDEPAGALAVRDVAAGDATATDLTASQPTTREPTTRAPVTRGPVTRGPVTRAPVTCEGAVEAVPRKRIRAPLTPEQRARRNAGRRRKWAETHRRMAPPTYTARQNKLIEAYLRLGVGSLAAVEAGYGNSIPYARSFLRRPEVAAIVAARRAEMRRQSEVTMERVIGELAKLAFADPRDLFTADGKLKPLHELDDASAASISALEVLTVAGSRRSGAARTRIAGSKAVSRKAAQSGDADAPGAGTVDAAGDAAAENGSDGDTVLELRKIKRWDKTKALELLGRYLGLFKDRLELGVSDDLAASIEAARKRSRMLAAPEAARLIEGAVVEGRAVDVETPAGEAGATALDET